MFQCFVFMNSAFCFLQEERYLYRMTSYPFYVLNAEQWNVFIFLEIFKLIFNFQKSRMFFLLRCCLDCTRILHIRVSIILALAWHLHLCSVYWFCQLLKMNDFSFFLDFRQFFGLRLISFNIRQDWKFDSKLFPKFPLTTIYCNFLPVLVLI